MNLEAPIFQNKDFRVALQYLFNFDRLNRNLMYNDYFRLTSFFQGTEYANPDVKTYEFSSEKAREHLGARGLSQARRQSKRMGEVAQRCLWPAVHPFGHRRHPRQR